MWPCIQMLKKKNKHNKSPHCLCGGGQVSGRRCSPVCLNTATLTPFFLAWNIHCSLQDRRSRWRQLLSGGATVGKHGVNTAVNTADKIDCCISQTRRWKHTGSMHVSFFFWCLILYSHFADSRLPLDSILSRHETQKWSCELRNVTGSSMEIGASCGQSRISNSTFNFEWTSPLIWQQHKQ